MPADRDLVAKFLHLPRPKALRVVYWLHRLHTQLDAVHGDVGIVPFKDSNQGIGVLVATVDYDQHAVGCAWCGEWLADHGQPLVEGTKAVQVAQEDMPHDIRDLDLRPAILYCNDCWARYESHLLDKYGINYNQKENQ